MTIRRDGKISNSEA